MTTHRRDDEADDDDDADAETDEPHDGSAECAVVSGTFSERFDHRKVVDEPANAEEKSVDNDKVIEGSSPPSTPQSLILI